MADRRPPPDSPPQLMELRESETLGMLDEHDARVRDVDADFDDGGRDEDVDGVVTERAHRGVAFVRLQAAVHQPDPQLRKRLSQLFRHRRSGLQIGALRLFDHRINHIRLPPREAFAADEFVDLGARRIGAQRGLHRTPPRWPFADLRDVQVPV